MGRKFSQGLLDDETILEHLRIRPGHIILDAGCGNGYMAKRFAALVGQTGTVYALDPDNALIEELRKEVQDTRVIPVLGDITKETGLEPSSVDLVYLSTVFHIFSPAQVVGFEREVRRILRSGGRLAVVNISKEDTPFGPPVAMRSSPEELRQKLSFAPRGLVDVGDHFYMQTFEKS